MQFNLATSRMTDDLDDAEQEDMAEKRDNATSRMTSVELADAHRRAGRNLVCDSEVTTHFVCRSMAAGATRAGPCLRGVGQVLDGVLPRRC